MIAAIGSFAQEGLAAGEPVLVLLPAARLARLRREIGAASPQLRFEDVEEVGRNPARILPRLRDWSEEHGSQVRVVCEPMWPGRGVDEAAEVTRHEALVNIALSDAPVRLLCVYDERTLPAGEIASAERTHSRIGAPGGESYSSDRYGDPLATFAEAGSDLAAPNPPVEEAPITLDLAAVREHVLTSRATAALPDQRKQDFVLAMNEAATNALKYDEPPRTVRLWRDGGTVVGEVAARGRVEDPLAGRRRPAPGALRGWGLWLVNQLCDLVQLRSSDTSTTLRMHMRCSPDPSGG